MAKIFLMLSLFKMLQWGFVIPVHAQSNNQKASAEPFKVGLALSGGGARGIAHIGVILALEEEGIPINLVAGTSMGSIVGGLYAAGYSGEEMRQIVDKIDWVGIFSAQPDPAAEFVSERYGVMQPLVRLRFRPWEIYIPYGLMNGQRISEELYRYTAPANFAAKSNFDSLVVPYRAMVVDASTGEVFALGRGDLAQAIRGSLAIPLVFDPARFDGRFMVDGGVLNILPTDVVKEMGADLIIAVDLEKLFPIGKAPKHIVDVATHTIDIMIREIKQNSLRLADVLIEPDLGDHPAMIYSGLDSLIDLGYEAAKSKMAEIKQLVPPYLLERKRQVRALDYSALDQAVVARIAINGRERVHEPVIVSEFPLKIGEQFNLEQSLRGVKNIYATGLFENVWLEFDHLDSGKVGVNINVVEKYPRTIGVGANYRNEFGTSGFVQIVHFNFLGWGERFMPQFRFGPVYKRIGLEVVNDRLFATPCTVHNMLFYEQDQPYFYSHRSRKDQLKFEKATGQVAVGIQPSKKWIISTGWRAERIWQAENDKFKLRAQTEENLSVVGALVFDNTDHHYFFSQGVRWSLYGKSVLIHNAAAKLFTKFQSEFCASLPLSSGQAITMYSKVGVSNTSLPIYEQFRLGGPDLPGFYRDELWGDQALLFGLKYLIHVYKRWYFQSAFSVGNVYEKIDEFTLDTLKYGVAAGLIASSPIGPIALMMGYGEGRNNHYISLGYEF